jgi:hypothetical protein
MPYFIKMDKNDMKDTIVEQMKLFNQDPEVFESERHNIIVGEYVGFIRRIYLPRGPEPTKYDVEYRISLSYHSPCGLKKNSHSWGAYIYINRPNYLNYRTFKSIKDTDYGVEWVRS